MAPLLLFPPYQDVTVGGWGGGGRRVSEFFDKLTKNLNLIFFWRLREGVGVGGEGGGGGLVNVGERMFQMALLFKLNL